MNWLDAGRLRTFGNMNEHLKGLIVTTLGVLLVVPDSLFVRLVDAEPLVIAFWRGSTAGAVVLVVLLAVQGVRGFRAVLQTGWPGWSIPS